MAMAVVVTLVDGTVLLLVLLIEAVAVAAAEMTLVAALEVLGLLLFVILAHFNDLQAEL
jgi:hypothetical protein